MLQCGLVKLFVTAICKQVCLSELWMLKIRDRFVPTNDVNSNNCPRGVSLGPCEAVEYPKGRPHRDFKFLRHSSLCVLKKC